MIRKGDIYKAQTGTDSQQAGLVLVVSSDDINPSAFTNVTVLPVVSSRKGVAPAFEVPFKLGTEEVKVQPPNLTAMPRSSLQGAAVGRINGALLNRIDTLIALHLALSPASLEGPGLFTGLDNEGDTL
jgi:mRNA-degrading endonuclease toxin of MazEF toxin-antitoxin module